MVSAARKLKALNVMRLNNWDYSNRRYLPEILKCVASTSLETIFLHEFQMSEADLLGFLGKQRETLKELLLMEACLLTGSCMSLVAWIKNNVPGLVALRLYGICESTDHPSCCDWNERKSYCVNRDDNMQVCLANILAGKYKKKVWKE